MNPRLCLYSGKYVYVCKLNGDSQYCAKMDNITLDISSIIKLVFFLFFLFNYFPDIFVFNCIFMSKNNTV